ncbi:MAG: hypothetical protein Udaeo_01990 [Candidatus Udaeobacter sp.]|nr:MAG: hypothetical protein Udaeo_01990 [Candidatus Udaeobacter sp.]
MPDVINTSLQRTVRNDEVIESELLCRYGFFLCLLLGRYRSFRGNSLRCFFALQIS